MGAVIKEYTIKYRCIMIIAAGILAGTCFANISKTFCLSWGIFNSSYFANYNDITVNSVMLWQYIAKNRLQNIAAVTLFGLTRFRKLFLSIYLVYIGACFGTFLSIAIMRFGIAGILIYILSVLPHYIFYGLAVYILYNLLLRRQICRKNKIVLFIVVLCAMAAGTYCEAYINPYIIKKLYVILY